MKYFLPLVILYPLLFFSCNSSSETTAPERSRVEEKADEIFYHVFQRSFYDSDGDLHGDLNGLEEKLDYLQDLGITSILLLPLYDSDYHHNYFPNDFKKIDPRYGTEKDYLSLIDAIHNRGMKLYMDMEVQYVTEKHPWFKDSYQNPESRFSDYVVYNGENNTDPETIIFGLDSLEGFDGKKLAITTVNLKNEKVKNYMKNLFLYWVDPNQDGDFSDGVDGFRIDHMMDDLDWKGKFTNLFTDFWNPIFKACRAVNPELKIIAEQANWNDYGHDYFTEAEVDMTFAFGVKNAITIMDKNRIMGKYDSTFMDLPAGKNQIIFLENHDTNRFAEDVESNSGKLQIGAALNILLKGVPLIYYGQELGMTGKGGFQAFGMTDGNDIPRREAFEWEAEVDADGHAIWYKDTGPWWD
ncbi:MAG: alpha-amylase, partial [Bacteroidetes bacterium]|nr:alpha-amylase [Bacteroidota bacterium]